MKEIEVLNFISQNKVYVWNMCFQYLFTLIFFMVNKIQYQLYTLTVRHKYIYMVYS